MGQDPNQPYSNPYGQQPPSGGGVPPQGGEYYQGYSQQPQPPNPGYQQPAPGYQQPPYGQPTPGYQQPPYGQPGAQGPYNAASPLGPTTINMEPNVAGGLSYFTWVAGLIFFLIEKQNRFVRFNAMQSILLSVLAIVVYVVLTILTTILAFSSIGCIFFPIQLLVDLGLFVLWVICIVNAFQGKYFKIPFIGDYAERWSGGGAPRV